MTPDEAISISRLAKLVDGMIEIMVTKDLLHVEINRIDEGFKNHISYSQLASDAETNRINAILKANAEILHQANTEANESNVAAVKQAETVATTLRELVETTRLAASKSQSEVINPIINRLNEIEQKQYENKGKEAVSDPMMAKLVERMENVATVIAEGRGRSGLSAPLLMMIAGLSGGILVYIVQSLIK